MVNPPSLRTRRFLSNLVYVGLFLAIAVATYLGFRPQTTLAETDGAVIYDNNEYAVSLEIPDINLTTKVVEVEIEDHNLEAPKDIVGTFRGVKNKEFLIGHSSTVFKNLKDLTVGAEIIYRGTKYYVSEIEIAAKSDIDMNEVLKAVDEPTLVFMTCYGEQLSEDDFSHRLIITANR